MPVEQRKIWARELQARYQVNIVLSCWVVGISRTAFYYQKRMIDDSDIIKVLNQLVEKHQRWGFPKCFKRIRSLGYRWNHKRVYRVYKMLKLNLKRKSKQRLPTRHPEPLIVPTKPLQCWSMDFMSDQLKHKVRFRTFNVIDDFNRQIMGIDIALGLPSVRITHYLDRLAEQYGYPQKVRVDNGPEFTSHKFTEWAEKHGVKIDFIKPGCPYQNAYIERFNRTYRHEVLDLYLFNSLKEVRYLTEQWIEVYNYQRPHDSLNDLTPIEFKNQTMNSTLELC